jgi:hypothetical protein
MNRRELIRLFGGSALVWPALARAQYDKRPVKIGLVPLGSPGNTYDRSRSRHFDRACARSAWSRTGTWCWTSPGRPAIPTKR